jgi:hypothetical protein
VLEVLCCAGSAPNTGLGDAASPGEWPDVGGEQVVDFEVADPPELVEHIALLARRYARAAP